MTTVNWNIANSTSDISASVSGTFEVTNTSNAVNVEIPTSITISSSKPGVSSFVPTNIQLYDSGVGAGKYITWRNTNPGQFPSTGVSFDLWCPSLALDIDADSTWIDVVSTGTFSLETLKWSVFYNYDVPDATWYGKGGTITFS
jgi:hypothetical protein